MNGLTFWALANFAMGLGGLGSVMLSIPWAPTVSTALLTVLNFCVALFLVWQNEKGPTEAGP